MRWLIVAAVLAFSAVEAGASEQGSDEAQSVVDMSVAAQGVTISAIPTPPLAIKVLTLEQSDRLRAVRKARLARKKASTAIMLTRTERRQVALLIASTHPGEPQVFTYDPHDNYQGGLDELDLHRSFNRPKVVDEPAGNEAEADDLPPHVRLRLMMARLKAVEAHALSQVPDTDEALPDSVLARLKEARLKAVEAHQRKFG
ncbi:MAG: hypothetical protein HGA71_00755 [Azonexaceae bacterium]|nr:hypothetical protein [Azonexaceae bacterium]